MPSSKPLRPVPGPDGPTAPLPAVRRPASEGSTERLPEKSAEEEAAGAEKRTLSYSEALQARRSPAPKKSRLGVVAAFVAGILLGSLLPLALSSEPEQERSAAGPSVQRESPPSASSSPPSTPAAPSPTPDSGGLPVELGAISGVEDLAGILPDLLHGRLVVSSEGEARPVEVQQGVLTSMDQWSITVRSSDGFEDEYGLAEGTFLYPSSPVEGSNVVVISSSWDTLAVLDASVLEALSQ